LRTVVGAKDFLMAGFTSAPDLGPVFGVKLAIDAKGMPGLFGIGRSTRYQSCC
jgi:hypothetical protein